MFLFCIIFTCEDNITLFQSHDSADVCNELGDAIKK